MRAVLREAIIVLLACTVVGSVFNALRSDGIPFIQRQPYEILVPCPETTGETVVVPADSAILFEKRTLLVDARAPEAHAQWRPAGAWNIPFDYLEPTPDEFIKRLAASGAVRVVVFGDGRDPDSGEHLAGEISGRGIKNVGYIQGGVASLRLALEKKGAP